MIMPSLNGKTALVTGASRGIGRASALALAAAGAQTLVHYGRGGTEADGVVAEIRKAGGRGDVVAADLERADGPHKLAKLTRNIVGDRLDILVANAGVSKSATIEDTTIEDFDKLFAVNVRAPFFLVQQLLPILSKGSSIVLVASLAARGVVGTIPAYAATKGAIDTLVKHFASLLGARGIRVNAVAPGLGCWGGRDTGPQRRLCWLAPVSWPETLPQSVRYSAASDGGLRKTNAICTQITTVKLPPGKQDQALNLMIERARFMATQPGFVSVNLHRSQDGSHLINYIQWTGPEKLKAAHQSPDFRKKWPQFGEMTDEIDPCLYEVVFTQAA
jgi:3-oxoacyl-[acyl-carrier protein] reductase